MFTAFSSESSCYVQSLVSVAIVDHKDYATRVLRELHATIKQEKMVHPLNYAKKWSELRQSAKNCNS